MEWGAELSSWMTPVGWALVHLLWQGVLLGAMVGVILWIYRDCSAAVRSRICTVGLAVLILLPIGTLALPEMLKARVSPGPRVQIPISKDWETEPAARV